MKTFGNKTHEGFKMVKQLSQWSLVVAANNESVLRANLLESPVIDGGCQVIAKWKFPSAGKAYNAGLAEAAHEIVVFAHQDVYLPDNWVHHLEGALNELSVIDPEWGVLGLVGIPKKGTGAKGYCYSTGLRRIVGQPFRGCIEAESLDEIVLVLRRSSGLQFDEELPGFHLYGADICLQAEQRTLKSYIIPNFCIHNSNGIENFPLDFWRSYFYLRRKWWNHLPIYTCCTRITKGCVPVVRTVMRGLLNALLGKKEAGSRWTKDIHRLYCLVSETGQNQEGRPTISGGSSGKPTGKEEQSLPQTGRIG